ncbi:MAG: S8 family serine peptidase [Bacteroidota bacterium]
MVRISFLLLFMLSASCLWAEVNRYAIFFTDKNNTPYSLDEPEDFLSSRALERRTKQGISLTENDLPVDPQYIAGLRQAGADVFYTSKWFNLAIVQMDETLTADLLDLNYVSEVRLIAVDERLNSGSRKKDSWLGRVKSKSTNSQLNQLGINNLHNEDFTGEGILIAIFDSGFRGVNSAVPFSSIFNENRLLDTFNFVLNNEEVYDLDTHGTEVLSVIGAEVEDEFVGAAPDASFALYLTEDDFSEYPIEQYNWLLGAERADSVGVDIINSSLGYNTFDSPFEDYTYEDMDGNTTIVSQAADLAASKGILVVTSVGNEGSNSWGFVVAPGDADSVLAVGYVNSQGILSSFSSRGPTSDGQIKPEVVARGVSTSVIKESGNIGFASGSSFSTPLIAGLAACVWQSNPDLTAMQLRDSIISIGDRFTTPDNQYGYGIPRYGNIIASVETIGRSSLKVFPNPTSLNAITVQGVSDPNTTFILIDANGKRFELSAKRSASDDNYNLQLIDFPPGTYLLEVSMRRKNEVIRILKR